MNVQERHPRLDEISAWPEATRTPAARSGVYAVLARGFSDPDEDVIQFFKRLRELRVDGDGDLAAGVEPLLDSAATAAPEELKREYMSLFDPVAGPFPYESEMIGLKDFGKAQLMADIMGFYKAFGVEPHDERPDHIVSELEFMHYLAAKECHALRTGREDEATVCKDAQKKFFREHLGSWTDSLLRAMRLGVGEAGTPFYTDLMEVLQQFIEVEKEGFA